MSWRRLYSKCKALFHRPNATGDLADEIRLHLAMEEQENLDSGMSEEDAHYAALRRFGNVTLTQERSKEMWEWNSMETLWQDIRFGLRQLRQNPGFTAVAVLTLTLGIGATTAIFSVVNAVLLRPLPFKQPAQLVELFETEQAPGNFPLAGPDYLDWQAQNHTLDATAMYSWTHRVSASGASEPESATVVNTQANFFDVLGVQPLAGRTFASGEDAPGKNHVAILSFAFWQRRFGGADSLGKTVTLNNEKYTVIGVMPRWLDFHGATDLWTPLDMSLKGVGPRGNHSWRAVGRVKTGVTLAQAREELLGISMRIEKLYPDSNNHIHAVLLPLKDVLVGSTRAPLLVLLGAVALVLLVACVNVANLQLARSSTRHREMAVRTSLGAGRWRIVRQLLTESVLLSLTGAALGTLGAWGCVRLFESVKSIPIPRTNPVQIDGSVLLFTVCVSILAGILFGLAPALQSSESSINEELKAGAQAVLGAARTRQILRDGLVIAEISITLALLVGAGLLLRSFVSLRSTDLGINSHNVLTMTVNLPEAKYPGLAKRRQFFGQLENRVRNLPGIDSVAISTEIPLEGGSNGYIKVGQSDPALSKQLVGWNYVTLEYFHTLDIPMVEGRNFDAADLDRTAATSQRVFALYEAAQGGQLKIPPDVSFVSIISQTTARTFWPNQHALGKSFWWNDVKVTVIGIVADVKEYGIRAEPMPQAYFPFPLELAYGGFGRLTVRTHISPAAAIPAIRREVSSLDGDLALLQPQTMDEVIAEDMQDVRLQTFLLGAFATLALLLAAVGLYGVMSYVVSQRTREIGIRMALGAQTSNVLRLVMRQGTILTSIGLALGMLTAFALTRSMSHMLYGVGPADPLTFVSVAALLALVALAAYYIPARRAARIDPVRALRYE